MLPEAFTGGWYRVSIAIDGGEPYEDSLVWWLQAGERHADLRVPVSPGAEPMSFAGSTVYDEPSLTWLPDLQLTPSDDVDTGVVSWDGDDLLEAGASGAIRYVERWRRIPGSEGVQRSVERDGVRMVRTGDVALTLLDGRPEGRYEAVAWRRVGGRWEPQQRWPDDATAPSPDQLDGAGVS